MILYHKDEMILGGAGELQNYLLYTRCIERSVEEGYEFAAKARSRGLDPCSAVESLRTSDLADRVSQLLEVPVAERLRSLLGRERTELAAFSIAHEIASGKFTIPEHHSYAETAVRVALAVITDGVTIAPLQGISAVKVKENQNSQYLSLEFAGPIRAAGATESALTLVIADQVRKTLGLSKYNPMAFDDEVSRFIEELRIYERDVGSFQYKVSDEDIRTAISNIPVEIDGVSTDNYEVVVQRGLRRIQTNKVRGGALRVLNDGIVGKSNKLLKLLPELGIQDWEWLSRLKGGKQQGSDDTSSHFHEVISGRPVLSLPKHFGGFRLRYGRAPNTGMHTVGIHPVVATLLDYSIVVGTQVKVDMPGKAASVAFVDSLEAPIVKLKDGSVLKVHSVEQAERIVPLLERILFLGDILVSYGDFLENNARLVASPYVEEWWALDFRNAMENRYSTVHSAEVELGITEVRLENFMSNPLVSKPSLEEAFKISYTTHTPLHPHYLLFWDLLNPEQILELRQALTVSAESVHVPIRLKNVVEILGVEHKQNSAEVVIRGEDAEVLKRCLYANPESSDWNHWTSASELISELSGLNIRPKASTFVGVRVGRPEKAMARSMKPPVHGLFPVGSLHRPNRDIVSAATGSINIELVNCECPQCNSRIFSATCPVCKTKSRIFTKCISCGTLQYDPEEATCPACSSRLSPSSVFAYPLKRELKVASLRVNYEPTKALKGVIGLSSRLKFPECLEKALLRQKYGLSVYRDGTVRYDLTNVPLTHFKPRQIGTSVNILRNLGYGSDIDGEALDNDDQTVQLLPQDIVIPLEAGSFFVSVSRYVDQLIVDHYGMTEAYYGVDSPSDLLGELVVGLAPHTSVGIIGRIIGYTNAQTCFATPYWHSAKRRDCDGDGDSIILLMDVLLNFSKSFLPSIIGGLMDAPLLLQPSLIPREVQRQAHHMDVMSSYPEKFYKATQEGESPGAIEHAMDIIKGRLGSRLEFENFAFTHSTVDITIKHGRSSYSTIMSLNDKLDKQIQIAERIAAVDPTEVVKSVLRTHLLPDIIGNTKAFTSQSFRCKKCGEKFRRIPVKGVCLGCGGQLQATVTRGTVEKYLQLAIRLSKKYEVGQYIRSRLAVATQEIAMLFEGEGEQTGIDDYMTSVSEGKNNTEPTSQDSRTENFVNSLTRKKSKQYQTTLFQ